MNSSGSGDDGDSGCGDDYDDDDDDDDNDAVDGSIYPSIYPSIHSSIHPSIHRVCKGFVSTSAYTGGERSAHERKPVRYRKGISPVFLHDWEVLRQ